MVRHEHSKEFMAEMKQKLLAEKGQLERKLGLIAHKHEGDYQATVPDYGRNEEENVSEVADYVALSATTEATEARLKEVRAALERITQGTYGLTDDGQLITQERLRANPAATANITRGD
jgi:RNA polymerase-binding transcription factor DksA